jgi:hypothetical protein
MYSPSVLNVLCPTGKTLCVHFHDVRLWSNALMFRQQQRKVNEILKTIRTHDLLNPLDFDAFCQCFVTAHLYGFPPASPTVFDLHELLDENWIGESILNARAYQIMQQTKMRSDCPTVFTLPSSFHTRLTNEYCDQRLSPDLRDIRESLLNESPELFAFVFNKSNSHWATCIVSLKDCIVRQGDSLRWSPDVTMLAKLQWFLGDVADIQGEWVEKPLSVPYQGISSGSCGIVALNAIEVFVDPKAKLWSIEEAANFRRLWLRKLLLDHLKAKRSEEAVSSELLTK